MRWLRPLLLIQPLRSSYSNHHRGSAYRQLVLRLDMSGRTPSGSGSSRAPLLSPMTSSKNTTPQSSYRRSRQPSSSSQASFATDMTRRPSFTPSQRKGSQMSSLGETSNREYGYRKRREGREFASVPEGETDWSAIEPDEVFRRLPVGEVRKVEGKMRAEAANKQSELRAMVG